MPSGRLRAKVDAQKQPWMHKSKNGHTKATVDAISFS